MTANDLDARYGRTPARHARLRTFAILAAVAVAVVVGGWVVWAGLFAPAASLEAKDLGFEALSPSSVEVRWQLTAPAGSDNADGTSGTEARQDGAHHGAVAVSVDLNDDALLDTIRTAFAEFDGTAAVQG